VDCRRLADTNGDGIIDENDTCIPVGELLNAMRSINLALPLIKAVEAGQTYVSPFGGPEPAPSPVPPQPSPQPSPAGHESFSAITWMAASGTDCKLEGQVTAFPSGAHAMVAAWSFSGMTDGEPWAEEWKLDGTVIYTSQYSWNFGSQGDTNSCLTSNNGFPDGNYHISLFAGDGLKLMAEADVTVGGSSPNPQPSGNGVVTLSGQIVDGDTMNPIPGAKIFVLKPGITFDQWKTDEFADADLFSYATADGQGNFRVPDKLALDTGYTLVIYAEGYKITYGDNLTWSNQDPVDFQMLIKMSK
jgi:hypothetical protein